MKNAIFFFFLITLSISATAQLKATVTCPELVVNILQGHVNNLGPDFSSAQIKQALPCFSSDEPESDSSKCGGLLSYKDKGIYFYTGRDYIEIHENFKGKLSLPLMGADRKNLFQMLGYPKLKDVDWDAFATAYGIIILRYNKAGKVMMIQFSKKTVDTIKLCE